MSNNVTNSDEYDDTDSISYTIMRAVKYICEELFYTFEDAAKATYITYKLLY